MRFMLTLLFLSLLDLIPATKGNEIQLKQREKTILIKTKDSEVGIHGWYLCSVFSAQRTVRSLHRPPGGTLNRELIDNGPNLSSRWFLCLRNGSVQACRDHDATHILSRTNSQESQTEDGVFDCHEDNCINGNCEHNQCVCNNGWQGRDCDKDIDECASATHQCSHGCKNTPGSYLCRCRDHYILPNDQVSCHHRSAPITSGSTNTPHIRKLRNSKPINPKSHMQHRKKRTKHDVTRVIPRRDFSAFLNVDGNISSMPLPFFLAQAESSGKSAMKSINNFLLKINALKKRFPGLAKRRNPCHALRCEHRCVAMTAYRARCICKRGYVLEGKRRCVDLDECESDVNPCSNNSMCINKQGSYSCTCNVGYMTTTFNSTNKVCEDVNECLTGEHICNDRATCINMPGYYRCACHEGYHGNGVECESTMNESFNSTRIFRNNYTDTPSSDVAISESALGRQNLRKQKRRLSKTLQRHLTVQNRQHSVINFQRRRST